MSSFTGLEVYQGALREIWQVGIEVRRGSATGFVQPYSASSLKKAGVVKSEQELQIEDLDYETLKALLIEDGMLANDQDDIVWGLADNPTVITRERHFHDAVRNMQGRRLVTYGFWVRSSSQPPAPIPVMREAALDPVSSKQRSPGRRSSCTDSPVPAKRRIRAPISPSSIYSPSTSLFTAPPPPALSSASQPPALSLASRPSLSLFSAPRPPTPQPTSLSSVSGYGDDASTTEDEYVAVSSRTQRAKNRRVIEDDASDLSDAILFETEEHVSEVPVKQSSFVEVEALSGKEDVDDVDSSRSNESRMGSSEDSHAENAESEEEEIAESEEEWDAETEEESEAESDRECAATIKAKCVLSGSV